MWWMLSFDSLDVSLHSSGSSSVSLFTVRFVYFCRQTFAECPLFPHLLQFVSIAWNLCSGVQFGIPQYLCGLFPVVLVFGRVHFASFHSLCRFFLYRMLSFVEIIASGILFFLFFFSYVFCLNNSIVFFSILMISPSSICLAAFCL